MLCLHPNYLYSYWHVLLSIYIFRIENINTFDLTIIYPYLLPLVDIHNNIWYTEYLTWQQGNIYIYAGSHNCILYYDIYKAAQIVQIQIVSSYISPLYYYIIYNIVITLNIKILTKEELLPSKGLSLSSLYIYSHSRSIETNVIKIK